MDPRFAVKIFEFIVLLFALSFHEAAHGWTASRLGDPTARMLGRVTLNPAKHIDLFGTILLLLMQRFAPLGRECLQGLLTGAINPELMSTAPVVFPLTLIFYFGIALN